MAFATVSIQKHPHQYGISKECVTIHCCYDILCTALFKALFHVPLLYFEHLPLQRSLHGPEEQYLEIFTVGLISLNKMGLLFNGFVILHTLKM